MTARHCSNAGVEVYESTWGLSLSDALREIADLVDEKAEDVSYFDIHSSLSSEGNDYYVTAYLHA